MRRTAVVAMILIAIFIVTNLFADNKPDSFSDALHRITVQLEISMQVIAWKDSQLDWDNDCLRVSLDQREKNGCEYRAGQIEKRRIELREANAKGIVPSKEN